VKKKEPKTIRDRGAKTVKRILWGGGFRSRQRVLSGPRRAQCQSIRRRRRIANGDYRHHALTLVKKEGECNLRYHTAAKEGISITVNASERKDGILSYVVGKGQGKGGRGNGAGWSENWGVKNAHGEGGAQENKVLNFNEQDGRHGY